MQKSLLLLEQIASSDGPQSVTEISRDLGVPLATAHRHLQLLVEADLLFKDSATNRYILGERAFVLALSIGNKRESARGRTVLIELTNRTTFTTLLGRLSGHLFVYEENIPSTGSLSVRGEVGSTGPLHATAIGKALLASMSSEDYEAFLSSSSFDAHTARTITNRAILDEELKLVRSRGYAEVEGEFQAEIASVAASFPVFQAGRETRYAVCISGHVSDIDALRSCKDEVKIAAERLKVLL